MECDTEASEAEILLPDTSGALAPFDGAALPSPEVVFLDERARQRRRKVVFDGTAENTRRGYASDFRYLEAYYRIAFGIDLATPGAYPLPVEAVERFILDHVEGLDPAVEAAMLAEEVRRSEGPHAIATIERRLATLATLHRKAGKASPTLDYRVRELLIKSRKALAARGVPRSPNRKKAATRDEVLGLMLDTCGDTLEGIRDRALLCVGFASGGRRRSEIVSFMIEDVEARGRNYVLRLRRSKTDQSGIGRDLPVKNMAAEALRRWLKTLAEHGITGGPLFRAVSDEGDYADPTGQRPPRRKKAKVIRRTKIIDGEMVVVGLNPRAVADIVKKRAALAGLDPSLYSGHSLRSGFVTTGGADGVPLPELMELTGHASIQQAREYYQSGAVLNNRGADLL